MRTCCYCGRHEFEPGSHIALPFSRDHIFPEFMGGKSKVPACKPCNDKFGYTFEATISNVFAPMVMKLHESGIRSPRRVVWRKAFQIDGTHYDLDSNWKAWPSKPRIERDETGNIKRAIFASADAAESFLKSGKAAGKTFAITQNSKQVPIQFPDLNVRLQVSDDLKRLAIKIAVATATSMGFCVGLLDNTARSYLLGEITETTHIRFDYQLHGALEALRPPLSHLVYVKGNGNTGRCYAVVQLYGFIQYYVILNDTEFVGATFACAATLDIVNQYAEKFETVEPYGLHEAPIRVNVTWMRNRAEIWRNKFNSEAERALGPGKLLLKGTGLEVFNH